MPDAEWWRIMLSAAGGGVLVQVARVALDAFRGAKADEREQLALTQQERADANTGFASLADRLQSSLDKERDRSDEQREHLNAIQDELDAALSLNRQLARRSAGWRDYAMTLRQDITDQRPPPPREIPEI